MQLKRSKQLYRIEVEFPSGMTKTVNVKAADRQTAEKRALKFQPRALRVKRDAA